MMVGDVTNSGVGEGNQVSLRARIALCTQCLEEGRTEASMAGLVRGKVGWWVLAVSA